LHSGRFDGFCLVSSDSDFTRLASRLREQGADVYGFGAQKTPESFRQACRRFIYTENLLPQTPVSNSSEAPKAKSLQPPSAALPLLKKAISQIESDDGWVRLDFVGSRLTNLVSDFDSRSYGFTKLSDLVRNTGVFDVEKIDGNRTRIRAKPKEAAKASVKGKRTVKKKVTVADTSVTARERRRASLDAAIARGLADSAIGRVKPVSEVFDRIEAKLKAKR
jgi:predicted transcriptional regulator